MCHSWGSTPSDGMKAIFNGTLSLLVGSIFEQLSLIGLSRRMFLWVSPGARLHIRLGLHGRVLLPFKIPFT
jgi:hypothetical protein